VIGKKKRVSSLEGGEKEKKKKGEKTFSSGGEK